MVERNLITTRSQVNVAARGIVGEVLIVVTDDFPIFEFEESVVIAKRAASVEVVVPNAVNRVRTVPANQQRGYCGESGNKEDC